MSKPPERAVIRIGRVVAAERRRGGRAVGDGLTPRFYRGRGPRVTTLLSNAAATTRSPRPGQPTPVTQRIGRSAASGRSAQDRASAHRGRAHSSSRLSVERKGKS